MMKNIKKSFKNARRKLEVHMDATVPCKNGRESPSSSRVTGARLNASNKVPKTTYACTVEAHGSTRQRVEPSLSKNDEDHIAGKGYNSMTHHNFVHNFIPMPQAMKTPDAKAAVDKGWKKLDAISTWQLDKVTSKTEVILKAQKDKQEVHFATLMDICQFKNAESEPKFQKYKGRVVLRGDIVKGRLWSVRRFY